MVILKKINGVFYYLVLVCLVLNFMDDTMGTKILTFVSSTGYWNFLSWLLIAFFVLSCISLLKKGLIFKWVPVMVYILFIAITMASFLLNLNEDL